MSQPRAWTLLDGGEGWAAVSRRQLVLMGIALHPRDPLSTMRASVACADGSCSTIRRLLGDIGIGCIKPASVDPAVRKRDPGGQLPELDWPHCIYREWCHSGDSSRRGAPSWTTTGSSVPALLSAAELNQGIDVISPTAPVLTWPSRQAGDGPTRRLAELASARPNLMNCAGSRSWGATGS